MRAIEECPECCGKLVAVPFFSKENEPEVDYLECENCFHKEAVSPMTMREWRQFQRRSEYEKES